MAAASLYCQQLKSFWTCPLFAASSLLTSYFLDSDVTLQSPASTTIDQAGASEAWQARTKDGVLNTYAAGEKVYAEGDRVMGLYFIIAGKPDASVLDASILWRSMPLKISRWS